MLLLDGLRVIDAASFIAGPVATTMLANLYRCADGRWFLPGSRHRSSRSGGE